MTNPFPKPEPGRGIGMFNIDMMDPRARKLSRRAHELYKVDDARSATEWSERCIAAAFANLAAAIIDLRFFAVPPEQLSHIALDFAQQIEPPEDGPASIHKMQPSEDNP